MRIMQGQGWLSGGLSTVGYEADEASGLGGGPRDGLNREGGSAAFAVADHRVLGLWSGECAA